LLHLQEPLVQVDPAPHCAFVPHMQPPAPQLSASVALQAVQVAPPTPHAASVFPALQVLPLQQPVQVVGSHTQVPAWQSWPTAHCAVVPHWQLPLAPQLSDRPAGQTRHDCAVVPQLARVGGLTQVVPEQHPPPQLVVSQLQMPPTQCWPAAHGAPAPHAHPPNRQALARTASQATHAAPPLPH
jgi:hypothetical protein